MDGITEKGGDKGTTKDTKVESIKKLQILQFDTGAVTEIGESKYGK